MSSQQSDPRSDPQGTVVYISNSFAEGWEAKLDGFFTVRSTASLVRDPDQKMWTAIKEDIQQ